LDSRLHCNARRALGGLQRSEWAFLLSTPAAATVCFPLVGGPLLEWRGGIQCGLDRSSVEYR
jgi:hypothetical protein